MVNGINVSGYHVYQYGKVNQCVRFDANTDTEVPQDKENVPKSASGVCVPIYETELLLELGCLVPVKPGPQDNGSQPSPFNGGALDSGDPVHFD